MHLSARLLQDELTEKRARVVHFLTEQRLDGVWLGQPENFAWFTGGGRLPLGVNSAGLLVLKDTIYLIAPTSDGERILQEEIGGHGVELRPYDWHRPQAKTDTLNRLTSGLKIGTDLNCVSKNLEPIGEAVIRLRLALTPAEQYRYRALCGELTHIVQTAAYQIKSGQSERDVAAEITYQLLKANINTTRLLIGADSRLRRFVDIPPTDNRICEIATISVVAQRGGLQAALTRLVAVDKITEETSSRHRAVTKVAAHYIHYTRPGRSLREILDVGAAAYGREGYAGEWEAHCQGGLIGYAPCELQAAPDVEQRIEAYQVLAWQASIGGIKSEDTMMVLPDRILTLTRTEDWPVIEVKLDNETYYQPDILRL
ncbi:MAG: M24 family metallopeptidase [Chloroflexi bacterium]|nr:M24 family metallopeptidase [Chloroflexota bacterium]